MAAGEFLGHVARLAEHMPPGKFVLNICTNRLNFAVGFCAAVKSGRTTLMPATLAPELIEHFRARYPDLVVLWDQNNPIEGLPAWQVDVQIQGNQPKAVLDKVPEIDDEHIAAYVFTSGSTGLPQAHPKTWGLLYRNAQAQVLRLRETVAITANAPFTLIGTVPAQHMYGFESTLLLAILTGNAFAAEHPFFPADIAQSLALVPGNKVLVSTPFHLSRFCQAQQEQSLELTPVSLVFCATAPLSQELARQIAHSLKAPLLEIYGCTESGQLATRSSADTLVWNTYADVVIAQCQAVAPESESRFFARGGHVPGEVQLGDLLDLHDSTHFELLGRGVDMINVAGKRHSLASLSHLLCSVQGVEDGVYFLPDETPHDTRRGNVVRPVAFVVAPGLTPTDIMASLRQKMDAVFLPRQIYFLESLPRNSTGKLPRQILLGLLQHLRTP
jgi:acyl-coenzyme A synthetase/AMP-(fatty) acid ligase